MPHMLDGAEGNLLVTPGGLHKFGNFDRAEPWGVSALYVTQDSWESLGSPEWLTVTISGAPA